MVCAAPAYLTAHGTPRQPQDLATHNCLTYTYFGKSLWQFTDGRGEALSVPVSGNLFANEDLVLLKAAEQGAVFQERSENAVARCRANGRAIEAERRQLPGTDSHAAELGFRRLHAHSLSFISIR